MKQLESNDRATQGAAAFSFTLSPMKIRTCENRHVNEHSAKEAIRVDLYQRSLPLCNVLRREDRETASGRGSQDRGYNAVGKSDLPLLGL